jgi:hypothetical protein
VARPFADGQLFPLVRDRPLPEWAEEIDCTCAIPATSNSAHLRANMGGGVGRLPDEAMRRRMERLIDSF